MSVVWTSAVGMERYIEIFWAVVYWGRVRRVEIIFWAGAC